MKSPAQKKEKIKNIAGAAGSFITSFLITVIAVVAVALIALKFSGIEFFTVESGSMYPEYPRDSLVFVKEVSAEEIQAGDVITYVMNASGTLVTHRVIAVDTENGTFTTQGDANSSADPSPVLWTNVVGKVVYGIPKVGAAVRVITSNEVRPYLIAAVAVFGVISVTGDILDKRRKKRMNAKKDTPAETAVQDVPSEKK